MHLRKGVSRLTIELVLLLLGVVLALLFIGPILSQIHSAMERLHRVGGVTTIEVMATTKLGTDEPEVYVRNLGPRNIELGPKNSQRDPSLWQVVIDGRPFKVIEVKEGWSENNIFEVGEHLVLHINTSNANLSAGQHRVEVYGPGSTYADPFGKVKRALGSAPSGVKEWAGRAYSRAKSWFRGTSSRARDAVKIVASKVRDAASEIGRNLRRAYSTTRSKLGRAYKSIKREQPR